MEREETTLQQRQAARQAVIQGMPEAVQKAFELQGADAITALNAALHSLDEQQREDVMRRLAEAGMIGSGQPDIEQLLQRWAPLLADIAAVALGTAGPDVQPEIEAVLPELKKNGWAIEEAVKQLWDGQRDVEKLIDGLDENCEQIVRHVLQRVEQSPTKDA